jgi:DNA polymerase
MGTDLHEQAADFVAERLREFASNGRVLRAERTALVQYVAVASARSAVPARTEYAMRKADQPLAEQVGMAVEFQRNGGLESPPSGPERMRTATDSPKALAAVTGDPAERANALKALEQRAAVCGQCVSVARVRRSVVRAAGSVHAEILFVGDVPSADEDAVGEPFRGPAGEMMDKMLMAMGLKRDEVFLAPALRCRPDAPVDLPRKPTDAERAACSPFLTELISVLRPRVIVAMGAEAYRALFGREALVGRVRSVWGDYSGIPVMTTFHPAHLITNPAVSVKRQVWEDLLKVLELLGHPISDKQRGYFLPKR